MKNRLLLLVSVALMLFVSSCSKDVTEVVKQDTNNSQITFITDQSLLDARIEKVNLPVQFDFKSANELNYTWVYNILPVSINGNTLSASTVDGYGNYAYVGWHVRGEEIGGEISVVSIEDPDNPHMIQYGMFPYGEFNDLEIKDNIGKLFVCGEAQKNISGVSIGDNAAMSISYSVGTNGLVTAMDWENYLPGYSANSITYVANHTVWVSKGSQGGLTVFRDYDLNQIKLDIEVANAKHFDATGDYGVLLYGVGFNESVLKVWDMNSLYAPFAEYTIPYDVTPGGKNSVDINYNYAYLAMGNDGVVKVDLTDGTVVNRFDYENGGFCNGVTVGPNYIYVAYGADGLFILDKNTFDVVGHWDFNGSCNYVKKVGDFLYIANGDVDGMIVLRRD